MKTELIDNPEFANETSEYPFFLKDTKFDCIWLVFDEQTHVMLYGGSLDKPQVLDLRQNQPGKWPEEYIRINAPFTIRFTP